MKSEQLSTKNIHVAGSGNKISEFPKFFLFRMHNACNATFIRKTTFPKLISHGQQILVFL